MKTLFALMLLALVSCGGNSGSSKSERNTPEQCPNQSLDGKLCMAAMPEWSVYSSDVNFPENFEIKINETILIDSCKSNVRTVHENSKVIVQFSLPYVPSNEALNIEITDKGSDCKNNALFHKEENVMYGVIVLTVQEQKSYSVSVNLNN